MSFLPWLRRRWCLVDWSIAIYLLITGVFVIWRASAIVSWPTLLVLRGFALAGLIVLPPRGSRWEQTNPQDLWAFRWLRKSACFVRYAYPLPLMLPFFQEFHFTVNALTPEHPYWFEPSLYKSDALLFGELPTVLLAPLATPLLNEIMHAFYFSYYLILVAGLLCAWLASAEENTGSRQNHQEAQLAEPRPAFKSALLGMTLAYLLTFLCYPFLPARGPWENPDLMAEIAPFQGVLFTPLVHFVIERGAVSGGCFPSSHVSGAWGLIVGLSAAHPGASWILAIPAVGMSAACIYTRLHHAVDIGAGVLIGWLGGWLGRRWATSRW